VYDVIEIIFFFKVPQVDHVIVLHQDAFSCSRFRFFLFIGVVIKIDISTLREDQQLPWVVVKRIINGLNAKELIFLLIKPFAELRRF